MPYMSADDVSFTIDCPKCGPTSVVLSDGHADDSIASCGSCSRELGRWGDVRDRAEISAAVRTQIDVKLQ